MITTNDAALAGSSGRAGLAAHTDESPGTALSGRGVTHPTKNVCCYNTYATTLHQNSVICLDFIGKVLRNRYILVATFLQLIAQGNRPIFFMQRDFLGISIGSLFTESDEPYLDTKRTVDTHGWLSTRQTGDNYRDSSWLLEIGKRNELLKSRLLVTRLLCLGRRCRLLQSACNIVLDTVLDIHIFNQHSSCPQLSLHQRLII
jgi:hypothetical protein